MNSNNNVRDYNKESALHNKRGRKLARIIAVLLVVMSFGFGLSACGSSSKSVSVDKMFTERDYDSSYDEASATKIKLTDSKIKADDGVTVNGNTATITKKGTYIVSGSSSNAQIVVDASKSVKIQLVLDNASINCETSCPIYVKQADKVFLTQAKGSTNTLSVSSEIVQIDDNTIDGVIFAKDDITLNGEGTLNISSGYAHGIVCKDDLKITEGSININASRDGLQGKSSVRIGGGKINIANSVEGIEGAMIYMCDGEVDLVASDDGLNASSDAVSSEDVMAIDENCSIIIGGGKLHVSANGDGIDSNGTYEQTGGEVYVDGPVSGADGALDVAGDAKITGGTIVAVGAVGMATNFTEASGQGAILVSVSGNAGDTITVTDSDGKEVVKYTAGKAFQSVLVSAKGIQDGGTYTITTSSGGSTSVTMSGTIYGSGGMGGGMGGDPGAGGGGGGMGGGPGAGRGGGGDPGAGGGMPM